jgi:glycine oxidase
LIDGHSKTLLRYNDSMSTHADVLILGGGVIGLTSAYSLAREGVSVAVVEKSDFGQEASWAGAGIIPPGNPDWARLPIEQLRAHSSQLFPALSAELRERTGIDNGYRRCGGIEFTVPGTEMAADEWRSEGVSVEPLSGDQLCRLEPSLAKGLGPACLLPDMAQVRNPRHVKALLAGCQAKNVQLIANSCVHDLTKEGSQITGVLTDRETLRAGRYLVATGAWTEALLQSLGCRTGIRPVRGQIALLNTGTPLLERILLWGSRYIVPRPDGRVLVGSTEEDAGFEKHTTAGAINELLTLGCRLVPALAHAPLERCWAGLRPGSPDGIPYIGPVPGFDNLFIAAGHFRAGIQLSPGTALVIKELFLGQVVTVPLEPFRLDRNVPL